MPKMKTNSGSKKRFALTGTGKIKRKHAFHSHILTKKSATAGAPKPATPAQKAEKPETSEE